MNTKNENFYELRSRRVELSEIHPARRAQNPEPENIEYPNRTSTPNLDPRFDGISKSIQDTSKFFQDFSGVIDKNLSVQNISSLFDLSATMEEPRAPIYNKELADLMANNIPKFELNSSNNPALELRSFINACENVLNLFPDNDNTKIEFFKLIKFRLGYNVQERITQDNFENTKDLETHLRSICHIKLNKGKLLNEIRHERQHHNEDVSHFVERLRKLIAQGRSEYARDTEFEREAIHTLKHSVKNELISIKLMDSVTDKFEELAEIAINRDSELHQRSYNTSKTDSTASQDLINELIQKIKNLEAKQPVTVQHIRHEPNFRTQNPNRFVAGNNLPQRSVLFCNYCKRRGHEINECRSKNSSINRNYNNHRSSGYNNSNLSRNQQTRRNFGTQNTNNSQNRNISPNRRYSSPVFSQGNHHRPHEDNYRNYNSSQHGNHSLQPNQRNEMQNQQNGPIICIRCNEQGHKSNNCYEIICRTCKQIGHSYEQCPQSTNQRRVHFLNSEHSEQIYQSRDPAQGN